MGGKRFRAWLAIALVAVIGLAGYRIGLNLWGNYHRRSLDAALARRDFAGAQSELAKCLWLWPGRAELHFVAARMARRQHNLPEAQRRLRQCRADRTLHESVALEEGLLLIQQGDFGNSEALDEYCASFPDSEEAMLIEEAQIEGSLAALDAARARVYLERWQRRQSPADRLQGLLWQAAASLLAKQVDEAARCFRAAVQLDPASREARLGLVRVLAHSDPHEALAHLQMLRRTNPVDAEVLYQAAVVDRNLGQLEAAAQTLDELFVKSPDHVDGLVLRGRLALDQRQTEEAGRWLRRAETLSPNRHAVLLAMLDHARVMGRQDETARYQQRLQDVVRQIEGLLKPPSRADDTPVEQPVVPGATSR